MSVAAWSCSTRCGPRLGAPLWPTWWPHSSNCMTSLARCFAVRLPQRPGFEGVHRAATTLHDYTADAGPTSNLLGPKNGRSDGTQPCYGTHVPTLTQRTRVPTIRFDATLYTIDNWNILRLPEEASRRLPSRAQVAVGGTINGHEFQTVLEPDGHSGHWMRVAQELQHTAGISAGDTATLEITSTKDWPEPKLPQDLEKALAAAPQKIQDLWEHITPMARWEWVRWVNATRNPETRMRRVEVTISKMNSGKRRPCCFDLAACTDPDLSRSGRLLDPTQ